MTREEYKQKLFEFNSTPKYRSEVDLLLRIMNPSPHEKILDYGCGLGRTVRQLNALSKSEVFGFDIRDFTEEPSPYMFRDQYHFKFHKIYFMHSIAHIQRIESILASFIDTWLWSAGRVYVITPNRLWLDSVKNKDYVPDPTVVKHFSASELEQLFVGAGFKIKNVMQFGAIENNQHERLFLEAQI